MCAVSVCQSVRQCVRLSVSLSRSSTRGACNVCRGHLVQPLPNYFGLLFVIFSAVVSLVAMVCLEETRLQMTSCVPSRSQSSTHSLISVKRFAAVVRSKYRLLPSTILHCNVLYSICRISRFKLWGRVMRIASIVYDPCTAWPMCNRRTTTPVAHVA